MRLQRFSLDRFGHFENKVIDLSNDVIHVIHGPNAAGKSTIRTAVAELLFGMDERTSYDFRFEKSQLRLSATLVTRDGNSDISVVRYKRRAKSLMSERDVELDEGALQPFLGGMDKATFLDLYVMDQEALRKGGEHMLSAEGDVGRSLFAASSGFADISALRAALRDELDEIALVGQKRKTQKLWKREEEYNEARERQRASLLRKGDWDAAKRALSLAQQKIETLTEERRNIETTRSLLERVKSVSLILPRLDRNRAILEELTSVPKLPRDFAERWRTVESELQSAVDAEEAAKSEKGRVETERQGLPQDADTIIAFAVEIENLHQTIGNIADLRQAKNKLERDVQQSTDRLTNSLAELGGIGGEGADKILATIPTKTVCSKIEELIAERGRIDAALDAADSRKGRARENLDEARALVERSDEALDPADAEAKWKGIIGQGGIRRLVSQAQQKAEDAFTAEAVAIARLAPWTGTADQIMGLSLPSPEAVASYEAKMRQNETDFRAAQDAEREAKASLREIDELISPQKLADEVPTESAVRSARNERDGKWTDVAGLAEAGEKVSAKSLAEYAGLVRRADDLIDLCVAGNELPALLRNRASLASKVEEAEGRISQVKERQSQHSESWTKLWQGVSWPVEEIPEPQMMQTWLSHIKICVSAIDASIKADKEKIEVEIEERGTKEALIKIAKLLGITLAPDLTSDQLRDLVGTAIMQSRRNWDDLKRAKDATQQHQRELAEATKEYDKYGGELAAWRGTWAEAMPLLHQKVDMQTSDCRHVLTAWSTIREEHTTRSGSQNRLEGVVRDLDTHERNVRELIKEIGPEKAQALKLPDDWALWPAKLHQTLREAMSVSSQIEAADRALLNATRIYHRCGEVLSTVHRACDGLRESVSLGSDTDVAAIIDQAARKQEAQEQFFQAETDLQNADEGLSETKLREEVASIEPDQVKAQLSVLGARALTLDESFQQASQERLLATQQIAGLEEKTGFTVAALDAAIAAQDVKQLAQRWMRLRAAQILLDRAVERYRKANEGPLIKRASAIFSAIVRGRMPDDFMELGVDYDNPERPLIVARRRAGASCSVPKMSTGTRDQLWLSLRIAALERRAEHIEPMPFLADDLFDSSDEARSISMLTAMAELARHTQVIVFTHHEHVASMASTVLGARAQLHRLQAANS